MPESSTPAAPESITVSLEWAKKLGESGWPQDAAVHFWWKTGDKEWEVKTLKECRKLQLLRWVQEFISAPTAEEILRRLPAYVSGNSFKDSDIGMGYLQVKCWPDSFTVVYRTAYGEYPQSKSLAGYGNVSLANAAAALYCYLAEHKLLPSQSHA